jgi:hypothetical protein
MAHGVKGYALSGVGNLRGCVWWKLFGMTRVLLVVERTVAGHFLLLVAFSQVFSGVSRHVLFLKRCSVAADNWLYSKIKHKANDHSTCCALVYPSANDFTYLFKSHIEVIMIK